MWKERVGRVFPALYRLRVAQLRLSRHMQNFDPRIRYARTVSEPLPFVCKRHQSLLRRRLGATDPQLQENKITNLRLSSSRVHGILIRPGETFSFWKLVGKTTARKGYIEGLLLSHGEVRTGVGGGICQLANLLFWLALHSPLDIVERHHHSFDPFPDDRRVLPFGSGASVFYNYVDLRFYNGTAETFQFEVEVADRHLKGTLRSANEWPYTYHMEEWNHRFMEQDGKYYRQNEIWRRTIAKRTGNVENEERIIRNFSEVKYSLEPQQLNEGQDEDAAGGA
ncbi:VanW family protein [Paenibacillus turpanensis]|uniref:VanW family protein n=1 Tax=Paenibacillus turpanensis TaxID=2689078 RepID=UPI00140E7D04|nr:VanW family protein [Paenibacillus turpanensis]